MAGRTTIETDFSIRTFKGGYDNNLTYLVGCMRTGAQCIVDAAVPYKNLKIFIRGNPLAVFITHSHHDHSAYLNEYLRAHPDLMVILHPKAVQSVRGKFVQGINDNHTITVGRLNIDAIHTPGHNPDSVCYHTENVLFTGDTLFIGRTGRTVSAGADTREMYRSVYTKILSLPKDTVIYPGHDYGQVPTATLKENIRISPLLRARDEDDFVQRMEDFEASRLVPKT